MAKKAAKKKVEEVKEDSVLATSVEVQEQAEEAVEVKVEEEVVADIDIPQEVQEQIINELVDREGIEESPLEEENGSRLKNIATNDGVTGENKLIISSGKAASTPPNKGAKRNVTTLDESKSSDQKVRGVFTMGGRVMHSN